MERMAAQSLADAVANALGPVDDVDLVVGRGDPSRVLLRESQDAALLVLGPPHPGVGGVALERIRPGRLMYRAPCPVLILTRGSRR